MEVLQKVEAQRAQVGLKEPLFGGYVNLTSVY